VETVFQPFHNGCGVIDGETVGEAVGVGANDSDRFTQPALFGGLTKPQRPKSRNVPMLKMTMNF
jgi:hypothetical protein